MFVSLVSQCCIFVGCWVQGYTDSRSHRDARESAAHRRAWTRGGTSAAEPLAVPSSRTQHRHTAQLQSIHGVLYGQSFCPLSTRLSLTNAGKNGNIVGNVHLMYDVCI